jgi:hypothetical protein
VVSQYRIASTKRRSISRDEVRLRLRNLHADQRWQALLKKLNLPFGLMSGGSPLARYKALSDFVCLYRRPLQPTGAPHHRRGGGHRDVDTGREGATRLVGVVVAPGLDVRAGDGDGRRVFGVSGVGSGEHRGCKDCSSTHGSSFRLCRCAAFGPEDVRAKGRRTFFSAESGSVPRSASDEAAKTIQARAARAGRIQ